MKQLQRILILVLLILPVIIGIVLLSNGKITHSSTSLKKIGVVRIQGIIMDPEAIVNQLQSFKKDKTIAGILIRIESPGGAAAPSQEIYNEILRIREAQKPVVVSMGNIAASGGYYVASPAKWIFADPGTITGSIGVIMTLPLYKDLAEKIGVNMRVYKAGKFKDFTSTYRQMSDGEEKILQSLLDDTHNQFIDDVAYARAISRDSIAFLADGRIFTGRQAVKVGLVDSLGGYHDALNYLRKISGAGPNARTVDKTEKLSIIREWLLEEIVHIFPQLYSYIAPYSVHFLYSQH